ncbi:unnamed protein product [Ectocarpus sp. 4 AP-2014]
MEKAFAGFNTTIFAYGQTGSGKTFSMQGAGGGSGEGAGIIPRMNEELFARVAREREADANKMFLVTCSYFEIYNEVIYDLLDPNNRKRKGAGLEIREHGVLGIYVKGLQARGGEMVVTSPDSMQRLIDQGMASRTVGSTAMNDTSSRSHSVFTIKVHQKDATDESKSTFAKINLVDLAGSERAKSTGATGARLKEGANINKSLSSLGNVINALVDVANGKKGVFVPYRNSKLTRVLQESLGGNSLTAMLAALSPAACNFEETLSTLKYASRAKSIKVNAVKNEEASQVSRLEEEVRALKQKLLAHEQQTASMTSLSSPPPSSPAGGNSGDSNDTSAAAAGEGVAGGSGGGNRYKQQIAEMEAAMKSTWEEKAKQSESSERERQRLQQQLDEEARREERERKKRWRALEDKGDLELSIREASEVALPTLPSRDWLRQVRALVAAENRAREEATVCAVYREALALEIDGVFSGDRSLSGSSFFSGLYGGEPDDDRVSVASTACTAVSDREGVLPTGAAAAAGDDEGIHQNQSRGAAPGDGSGGGGSLPRQAVKAASSYDPVLLRQLQARLKSLRDARERLNGPLTRAVEESSKKLVESVESFTAKFAASPHEHIGGGVQRRGGAESKGDEGATPTAAGGGGARGEMGEATSRRAEARKSEGVRALALIRRQVVARGRQPRQQRSSGTVTGGNGEAALDAAGQPIAAAIAAAQEVAAAGEAVAGEAREGEGRRRAANGVPGRTGGGLGTEAEAAVSMAATVANTLPARAADAEALCPAAVVIARAVEAILCGTTASFAGTDGDGGGDESEGRGGVSSPETAAPSSATAELVATNAAGEEKCEDVEMVADGGDGSQAERKQYRETLEGLGKALGTLRKALEAAAGHSKPSLAISSASVDEAAGVDRVSRTQGPSNDQAGGSSSGGDGRNITEGGASAVGLPQLEVLPASSQWRFRCSSGGRAASEDENLDRLQEQEDKGDNNGCCFTWEPPAAGEGDGGPRRALSGGSADGGSSLASPGCWVEVDFGKSVTVKGLTIEPLANQTSEHFSAEVEKVPQQPRTPATIAGFGIEDADGSVGRTEIMVGEVMGGGGGILKSTPPAKLLARPPVRFLYDLFRAVAKATGFGEDEACGSKWEDLSGKKDKMRFMEGMTQLVAESLGLDTRPAKGSDIVVGQECDATNRFLQLLALAARLHQNREEQRGQQHRGIDHTNDDSRWQPSRAKQLTKETAAAAVVATSFDGVSWEEATFVAFEEDGDGSTGHIDSGVVKDSLPSLTLRVARAAAVRCRHLRLSWPAKPASSSDDGSDNDVDTTNTPTSPDQASDTAASITHAAPAFDPGASAPDQVRGGHRPDAGQLFLGVKAFRVRVVGEGMESATAARCVGSGRGRILGEEVDEGGGGHRFAGRVKGSREVEEENNTTQDAAGKAEAQEQAAMGLLLEAMRTAVDRLLRQSLEWGRIEAANQDRRTAMRTNKMESLEKRLKASNEAKLRLAKDKKSITLKATRTEEENLRLQEQVLRLRADVGRERVENASLAEGLAQAETRVEEEKARLRELEELKRHLDSETEDLQNQVEVLTEERDVARSHEEELFAKLTERTEDLEALQESYVSLTDRWNDFQDEHDEVLEQLESFRATFKLANNSSSSSSSSSTPPPRPDNTEDVVEAAAPQVSSTPRTSKAVSMDGKSADDSISSSDRRKNGEDDNDYSRQQQLGTGGSPEGVTTIRPISEPEGGGRSSHAPPRPASGRSAVGCIGTNSSTVSPREELKLRLGGVGDSRSSRSDDAETPSKGGSGRSPRRSPPRRPPSFDSAVPSPHQSSSPRMSGSACNAVLGTAGETQEASGLRRRWSTEDCAGYCGGLAQDGDAESGCGTSGARSHATVGGGGANDGGRIDLEEKVPGRGDDCGCSDGETEVKSRRGDPGGKSVSAPASACTAGRNPGILQAGDSGGYYEDDFDEFVEEASEESVQQTGQTRPRSAVGHQKEEVCPSRGASREKQERNVNGGGGSQPPAEILYRPPSSGSRGKGERPKSAARQGRSASLNGA